MARPPKELVDAICESLRERPEEWCFGKYRTSNGRCGVSISSPDDPTIIDINVRGVEFGGLTFFSAIFGMFVPWRVRISWAVWRARPDASTERRSTALAAAASLRGAS